MRSWNLTLPDWNERVHGAKDLVSIEEIFAPAPHHKLKGKISDSGIQTMEVVLHADESDSGFRVLEEFRRFLQVRKLSEGFERYFFAQGLCFIELDALAERSEEIATFSTVRALRKMPELRILRPQYVQQESLLSAQTYLVDHRSLMMLVSQFSMEGFQKITLSQNGSNCTSSRIFYPQTLNFKIME